MADPINVKDIVFTRARNGYNPTEVDGRIRQLIDACNENVHAVRALKKENESIRRSLDEANSMIASLDREISSVRKTSTVPQATTDKMAKMLRVAIDEAARMENEARAESAEIVAAAHADAEMLRTRHQDMLAEASARQEALEMECTETLGRARNEAERIIAQAVSEADKLRMAAVAHREKAEAELNEEVRNIRAEAQAEAARHLANADEKIRHRTAGIDRSVDNLRIQRIEILEQLGKIYSRLEDIPSALEAARLDRDHNPITVTMISPALATAQQHQRATSNEHELENHDTVDTDVTGSLEPQHHIEN